MLCKLKYILSEKFTLFNAFENIVNLFIWVELLVHETNIYIKQSGRNFLTKSKEMKSLFGLNLLIEVNELPSISHYWY